MRKWNNNVHLRAGGLAPEWIAATAEDFSYRNEEPVGLVTHFVNSELGQPCFDKTESPSQFTLTGSPREVHASFRKAAENIHTEEFLTGEMLIGNAAPPSFSKTQSDFCIDREENKMPGSIQQFQIPVQKTHGDCGVFICLFAASICAGKRFSFQQRDIAACRERLVSRVCSLYLFPVAFIRRIPNPSPAASHSTDGNL